MNKEETHSEYLTDNLLGTKAYNIVQLKNLEKMPEENYMNA